MIFDVLSAKSRVNARVGILALHLQDRHVGLDALGIHKAVFLGQKGADGGIAVKASILIVEIIGQEEVLGVAVGLLQNIGSEIQLVHGRSPFEKCLEM